MRSLRRDLFERHLWPLAIVLIAAIVAVPFLLHGHRSDASAIPAPVVAATVKVAATTDAASDHVSKSKRPRSARTSNTRSPFTAVAAEKGSKTSKTSTGSTPESSSTAASASTSSSSDESGTSSSTPTSGTTTPAATPPAATPPAATTPSSTPKTGGAKAGPWKIYSVELNVGAATRHDVANLTPLPSERLPVAMYLGLTDHAREATFALGAGVGVGRTSAARSAGVFCHPSLNDCAILVVPAGKSARLSYTGSAGPQRELVVGVRRISTRITDSAAAVKAAAKHQSATGLCDLQLGDPIGFYDPTRGTVQVPSLKACRHNRMAVPFPGSLGAGSAERG